jgi:GntR family transcriptional regulator
MMIDIQHDSPVPIHEQITGQLRGHIASGVLQAGALLPEYRAFAQELLTNPQAVARAYGDLEWEGVLRKTAAGMEITARGAGICKLRLQELARDSIRRAALQALAAGLGDAEIVSTLEQALAQAHVQPLSAGELRTAIQKSKHEPSHRDSQGIQALPRQGGAGPA